MSARQQAHGWRAQRGRGISKDLERSRTSIFTRRYRRSTDKRLYPFQPTTQKCIPQRCKFQAAAARTYLELTRLNLRPRTPRSASVSSTTGLAQQRGGRGREKKGPGRCSCDEQNHLASTVWPTNVLTVFTHLVHLLVGKKVQLLHEASSNDSAMRWGTDLSKPAGLTTGLALQRSAH